MTEPMSDAALAAISRRLDRGVIHLPDARALVAEVDRLRVRDKATDTRLLNIREDIDGLIASLDWLRRNHLEHVSHEEIAEQLTFIRTTLGLRFEAVK